MPPDSHRMCLVGDIAAKARNALVGGPFGSDLISKDYAPNGVPVIRGANMGNGRWVGGEFVYVSHEKAESLSANCARSGDLIFTQRGTLGQVALVPPEAYPMYLVSQSQMKLTVDPSVADSLFLYYVFSSAEQQQYIRKNAIQTGVPHTNLGILRNTPVLLPNLAEQKVIARVLGSLDDRIELNRRMNATLEATAHALFQSWFVDFDPVRAKLDGRAPFGLDDATAALFPESFEESSTGRVPLNFRVGTVSDLATIRREAVVPNKFLLETFDHYSLPAFDDNQMPRQELGAAIMSNKFAVSRLSVLLSKLNPHIPRVWMPFIADSRRSVCSTEFMVFDSKPEFNREYIYLLFSSSGFLNTYQTLVTGTTGSHQRIKPESVLRMRIVVPPAELVRRFGEVVGPLLEKVNQNLQESRTLAALRDSLLPKLLSGELRVPAHID